MSEVGRGRQGPGRADQDHLSRRVRCVACWAQIDRSAFSDALADCNRAIRADDKHPYAYHNRGIAQAGLENPSAAIADFDHALAMRPNFANTLLNRAKAYITLGNTPAAIRDFEEVLRQKPDNEEARSNLAFTRRTDRCQRLARLEYALRPWRLQLTR